MRSPAEELADLDDTARAAALDGVDVDALYRSWRFWARPEQVAPPGDWLIWLVLTGRGWGKTRTGAEWVCDRATEGHTRGALISRTAADVRDVMLEGESGLGEVCDRRGIHYDHVPSRRQVTLRLARPNGPHTMRLTTYSAQEPDQLAGPQHDTAWGDEPAGWPVVLDRGGRSAHDNLMFGLRLGPDPRCCYTGTPRATAFIRGLVARDGDDVHVTTGSLYDNVRNLAPTFVGMIVDRYEGTRLGRQEIHGEVLADAGLLFQRRWFEVIPSVPPGFDRRTRAWDLAATEQTDSTPDPDWTAGVRVALNPTDRVYVIEDARRARLTPGRRDEFIKAVAREERDQIRRVHVEEERGGAGVVASLGRFLDDVGVHVRPVKPVGKKAARIELLATLAEQGRVKLLAGSWNQAFLDEAEEFDPLGDTHPHDDLLDAATHAVNVLRDAPAGRVQASPVGRSIPRPSGGRRDPVTVTRGRE